MMSSLQLKNCIEMSNAETAKIGKGVSFADHNLLCDELWYKVVLNSVVLT